jgi:hypothetical protein
VAEEEEEEERPVTEAKETYRRGKRFSKVSIQ